MEEKSINEQTIEAIQEEVKRTHELLNNDSYEFQDRHIAMQTYLLFRMLEEIEGIHNGFYVLYNERNASIDD